MKFGNSITALVLATTQAFLANTAPVVLNTTPVRIRDIASECPQFIQDNVVPTFIGDTTDCHKFYTCTNGQPHLHQCPGNLVFDIALNVCNFPRLARTEPGCNA